MTSVFISHSTKDQRVVRAFANILTKFELEVFVAEQYLTPDEHPDTVCAQIDKADYVVVLLMHGARSPRVQQECEYALKRNKPIIPLVEKKTDPGDLKALQGQNIIEYDPEKPQGALIKASSYVKSLQLKKEEKEKALLIVGGILAFILLLSGGKP